MLSETLLSVLSFTSPVPRSEIRPSSSFSWCITKRPDRSFCLLTFTFLVCFVRGVRALYLKRKKERKKNLYSHPPCYIIYKNNYKSVLKIYVLWLLKMNPHISLILKGDIINDIQILMIHIFQEIYLYSVRYFGLV